MPPPNPNPTPRELSAWIKAEALSLGFTLTGVSAPLPRKRTEFFNWWVDQGFGAGMHFLRRQKERRQSLDQILPGAKAALVVALRFPGPAPEPSTTPNALQPEAGSELTGKVARYALNVDYHARLLPLLETLAQRLDQQAGTAGSLAYVDTGALNERALAAQAGLGWVGKNAMLISPAEGSWFWLGEIITRAELEPDEPLADHCGKCRRCLDACPTGAIFENLRAIDSRKCLSYWNIEHRGPIPSELHAPMGEWLLGCDICQEVCPWNGQAERKGRKEIGAPAALEIPLHEIFAMDKAAFKQKYGNTALARAKLEGLQRNAKIVQANQGRAAEQARKG